ncbi:MAG: VCBS repeat-containing protein [Planctomycetota bacterium]
MPPTNPAFDLFALSTLPLLALLCSQPQECAETVLAQELPAGPTGPQLWTPDGAPVLGGPFSLAVDGGPAGAAGVLALGAVEEPLFLPAYGATVYAGGTLITLPFVLDGEGRSPELLALDALPPELCGVFAVAQGGVLDAAAPGGVAFTNALRLRAGASTAQLFGANALTFQVPGVPSSLDPGDVDGDGLLDLVVATFDAEVLLGDGLGDFAPAVGYSTGAEPRELDLADLNGDGVLDLGAVGNSVDARILLGQGDGSFGAPSGFPVGDLVSIEAGDFDADGDLDLALGEWFYFSQLHIALGAGDGTFAVTASYDTGEDPFGLATADVDLDGVLDIATANNYSLDAAVLLGVGDGTFGEPVLYDAGVPFDVALGDVNGDGFPDMVVGGGTVYVWHGDGTGAFSDPAKPGLDGGGLAIADLDGDGTNEAAVLDGGVATVVNTGPFTYAIGGFYQTGGGGSVDMVLADFNSDGLVDAATANQSSVNVSLLPGNGGGGFEAKSFFAAGFNPWYGVVEDFDADGVADVAVADLSFPEARVLLGKGGGSFDVATEYPLGGAARGVAAEDVDEDGNLDLLIATWAGVAVLLGQGDGGFVPGATVTLAGQGSGLAVSDFNADGHVDLAAAVGELDQVEIRLGNGDGTFGPSAVVAVAGNPGALVAADFDGDGAADVVGTATDANAVFVLLGAGDGSFAAPQSYATGALPASIAAADFDDDGDLDLATTGGSVGTVWVLAGAGDGSFGAAAGFAVGTVPRGIAVADLSGDGKLDLAVACVGTNNVRVLRGDGAGGFQASEGYPVAKDAALALAADLDRDGNVDLLVGADDFVFPLLNATGK